MLFCAHTGITLGSALALGNTLIKDYSQRSLTQCRVATNSPQPRLNSLAGQIDYRLILVGSLLPDIIDKPVGMLLLRGSLGSGRMFCHSLLFLVILSLAAGYFYSRRGTTWLLVLSFGIFTHLILDQMWLMPRTLLWPIYGWAFERVDVSHWLQDMFHSLQTDPAVYIPELVGATILVGFVVRLVRRKRVYAFVREGKI